MSVLALAACAAAALALEAAAVSLHSHMELGAPSSAQYYWPHARGRVGHYSMTNLVGPSDLNTSLAWSWHHPLGRYHTTLVGAPLLDDQKNIYLTSEDGVRKFSPDGKTVWYYATTHGPVPTCASLWGGAVFGNTQDGWVFALDMRTGQERWAVQKAAAIAGDTAYVEAHDGIVVTGVDPTPTGGAMRLLGLDAKDGSTLWEYRSDACLWNVMPVFTGDGAFVVMDTAGGVHKHALHNSTLHWKASPPLVSRMSISDGGVMVGPDGTSYTCSNYQGSGQQGMHGALRAYHPQNGKLLWDRFLDLPCNSWPVVSQDGHSVIVPSGAFVNSPAAENVGLLLRFRKTPGDMRAFSLSLGNDELSTYGLPEVTAAVKAFDTRSGQPQWTTELPPYGRLSARGDEEGLPARQKLGIRTICLPAQFGSPTISRDGTVYVGRADGRLYAVESGTGRYRTFDTGAGFLHPGTSWAPGMMAVASCDGLFVWKL
eukprot:CAMPEP_0204523412 /NCGR_PEP_ID=MMETSP0661-20131031/6825_1 /ASSEMBLY_ACC=CAM_ASM_000606 /TAXON_ID=109239 /ORGANISM="Alexandrium margalefi, Strain AMGDE01CS-322" /LENGTH=483 /DNA_ID=CAMNT_0051529111 /DNA_START=52 /DNA_END=1503 /DNA_ORIENTATION=+